MKQQKGVKMKYFLLVTALLLSACGSSTGNYSSRNDKQESSFKYDLQEVVGEKPKTDKDIQNVIDDIDPNKPNVDRPLITEEEKDKKFLEKEEEEELDRLEKEAEHNIFLGL